MTEKEECSICMGEYKEGEIETIQFGCSHRFHSSCLFEWIHSMGIGDNTSRCPLCRQKVIVWPTLTESKKVRPYYRFSLVDTFLDGMMIIGLAFFLAGLTVLKCTDREIHVGLKLVLLTLRLSRTGSQE